MDDRERRVAQNEALFREVNEHVTDVHAHWRASSDTLAVICECGNAACAETLDLTRTEYEGVRNEPARFIVLPGHEIPEVERVVDRRHGYFIVEKTGESKAYVEHLDPRAR
jgi:hypothetical protein